MPALQYPLINGNFYSFASIEVQLGVFRTADFTAINYSTGLDVADVYGTRPQKLGTTRGRQTADGSLEMYLRAWELLRLQLRAAGFAAGIGYGEVRFPIIVQYAEPEMPTVTDTLLGVRIVKATRSHSDGTDPLKVSLDLNVMRVFEGGDGAIAAAIGIGF
jgi:hypothetical protein